MYFKLIILELIILVAFLLAVLGCATPLERKQNNIINCVKELHGHDFDALDSFEVCRQVYRLQKVRE